MITYKFKWRRRLAWRSIVVVGHAYVENQDKIVLYLPDGSQREIKHWSDCEIHLERDGIDAIRKNMEAKAGASIPTNFG